MNVTDYELQLRGQFRDSRGGGAAAENRERDRGAGRKIKPDPALLETLVYLTEYPTPIAG